MHKPKTYERVRVESQSRPSLDGRRGEGRLPGGLPQSPAQGWLYDFSAISGTSVGAMNAVLLAAGKLEAAEEAWTNLRCRDIIGFKPRKILLLPLWLIAALFSEFCLAKVLRIPGSLLMPLHRALRGRSATRLGGRTYPPGRGSLSRCWASAVSRRLVAAGFSGLDFHHQRAFGQPPRLATERRGCRRRGQIEGPRLCHVIALPAGSRLVSRSMCAWTNSACKSRGYPRAKRRLSGSLSGARLLWQARGGWRLDGQHPGLAPLLFDQASYARPYLCD